MLLNTKLFLKLFSPHTIVKWQSLKVLEELIPCCGTGLVEGRWPGGPSMLALGQVEEDEVSTGSDVEEKCQVLAVGGRQPG